jgi:molecular chaperone DnaJ
MATDYYGVLGLRPGASDTDIKRAYRKMARDLHPDVNPEPGAKEQFQQVSRAYEALTDPEKRRIIDLGGDPYDNGGRGGGGSPFGGGAGFGGLGDIMDAFFGGAAARGPRSRTREGEDALIRVELDLDETVFGTTTEITGHPPDHLLHLQRPRRGAERAALLPRPGHRQPALPHLPGDRPGHSQPVSAVRR